MVEPEKTPRERAEDLISLLVPDWRPTPQQVLWTIRIVLGIIVLLGILTLIGLPFGITLWAWVKLLIVPAVLAVGGYLFNSAQSRATQAAAEWRAQEEALQAYLDGMSQLLTDKDRPLHKSQRGDSLSRVARTRTLTVLWRLDGDRKARVVQFLYESGLITSKHPKHRPIVDPIVDMSGAVLSGINLRGAYIPEADLSVAYLNRANLKGAKVTEEQLAECESLEGATMPDGQTLRGVMTPNGPTFVEWLKGKDREARKEDAENE